MKNDIPSSPKQSIYQPCKHCGTPFSIKANPGSEFCCNGCQYVFSLINAEGLEHYYQLRDKQIDPVKSSALQNRDFSWLEKKIAEIEHSAGKSATAVFDLEGISCIGCVWLIEKIFRKLPGSQRLEINTQYGQIKVAWAPGIFPFLEFARQIQQFGYVLGVAGERPQSESKRLVSRMGIAAACGLNAMLFTLPRYLGMEESFFLADLFELLTLLFTTISLLACGSYFIKRGFQGLFHNVIHIDLPISLGILFAYAGSVLGWLIGDHRFLYFDFVAIFIFLMLVGRWMQERALESNRNRLLSNNKTPRSVQTLDENLTPSELISIDELNAGTRFRILPGEVIPVLAELENREAGLSLEWINGESDMQTFRKGQLVPSGGQNIGREPILLTARQKYGDSTLARLLESAQEIGDNTGTGNFLKAYLLVVLATAAIAATIWATMFSNPVTGLQVALSILVVSCPCALGVALPFAQEFAIIRLRRIGVFVRQPSLFRRLSDIRRIIFDKTGTLTLEAPCLDAPEELDCGKNPNLSHLDRAVLRAIVESSMHPVSRATRDALLVYVPEEDERVPADLQIEESIGNGLVAISTSIGSAWKLGKAAWAAPHHSNQISGTLFVSDRRVLANLTFSDTIRDDAAEIVHSLGKRFHFAILSGDESRKVKSMAKALAIPEDCAFWGQTPQEKADFIAQFPSNETLFIGDGANDALAFRSAAARGTPSTPHGLLNESADFFFTGRSLKGIEALFHIQGLHKKATRAVVGFALLYNFIAVGIAGFGYMHPLLAAILMPLSSIATLLMVTTFFHKQR